MLSLETGNSFTNVSNVCDFIFPDKPAVVVYFIVNADISFCCITVAMSCGNWMYACVPSALILNSNTLLPPSYDSRLSTFFQAVPSVKLTAPYVFIKIPFSATIVSGK